MSNFGLRWLNIFAAHRVDVESGRRRRREQRRRRRLIRQRRLAADAFSLPDREFIKTYRLTKSLVGDLIEEVKPHIPRRRRSDGLDVAAKILVTLCFYASGSYQTLVGQSVSHAISQSTVSRAVKHVTNALNSRAIFKKNFSFPLTSEARQNARKRFYTKFGMPGVVGCVDGTHVSIVKPSLREEAYYCRKGYHSLNVMIICDADQNILCVDPSAPGSTHDSTVWRDHPLNNYLLEVNSSGETNFLLGDSGYPLRQNVMTPLLHTVEGTPEAHYYNVHVKTRNVVERTIGVLKARFRCLLVARQLHYHPEMAAKIVNACCVLHNIANRSRVRVPELSERELAEERRYQLQQRHDEDELTAAPPVPRAAAAAVAPPPSSATTRNAPLALGRDRQQVLVRHLWQNRRIVYFVNN